MLVSTTLTLKEKQQLLKEIKSKLSVIISSTKPSSTGTSKYLWCQVIDRVIIDKPDKPTDVEGVLLGTSVYNPEVYAYALSLDGEELLSIENATDDISKLDSGKNVLIKTVE